MIDDVIDEALKLAADECAKCGMGRARCRATWLSRVNM